MLAGYSFRPRLWAWALVALGCVVFVSLGNWQTRRAEEKRALAASLQPVSVVGVFVAQYTVFLEDKVRHGRNGYEVLTPLKASGADRYVLVDRGWMPADPRRADVPQVRTPSGEVRVEGAALERLPQALKLESEEGRTVRRNLDVPAFAAEIRLPLQPGVIEQHNALDDGLDRDWPAHDAGAEQSESYALQWYSFAALAAVLGLVFSFRKK